MLGALGQPVGAALEQIVHELPAGRLLLADGQALGVLVPLHQGGDHSPQRREQRRTGISVPSGPVALGRLGHGQGGVDQVPQRQTQLGGPRPRHPVGVERLPSRQPPGRDRLVQHADMPTEQVGGHLHRRGPLV